MTQKILFSIGISDTQISKRHYSVVFLVYVDFYFVPATPGNSQPFYLSSRLRQERTAARTGPTSSHNINLY